MNSPPEPDTLFAYTVTPPQVSTSDTNNDPVTLTIGVYNPPENGFVACSMVEFAISIGTTPESMTDDWGDVDGQSNQATWGIQKLPYTSSPLVFQALPAPGTTGLGPKESLTFELTGINVSVEGDAPVYITEGTASPPRQGQATVNKVSPGLVINYFRANPPSIKPGWRSTLSWATEGASGVEIDQLEESSCQPQSPPESLPLTGEITVCPLQTTTYTLTAHDQGGGNVQAQATITVTTITISITAKPNTIDCQTAPSTLEWQVTNATSLRLDPGGIDVTRRTSYEVTPEITTPGITSYTYTLTASNDDSSPSEPVTVYINLATITSFSATPTEFVRGQPVTLAWETEKACSCQIDQGVGPVQPPSAGSVQVTPQQELTYTLTASGLGAPGTNCVTLAPQPSGWTQANLYCSALSILLVNYKDQLWMIDAVSQNGNVWSSPDGARRKKVTSSLPFANRFGCTATVFDDGGGPKMWVTGGLHQDTNDPSNDVWSSTDGVNWTQVQTSGVWPARYGHACLAWQGKIWVMGGFLQFGPSYSNDVWSSPDGVNWTQVTANALWAARSWFGAGVFTNQLWICGGWGSADTSNAWYTNDGVNWSQAKSLPLSVLGCSLQTLNGQLLLIGIQTTNETQNETPNVLSMWFMDVNQNWTQSTDPLPPFAISSPIIPTVVFDWRLWLCNASEYGWAYLYCP